MREGPLSRTTAAGSNSKRLHSSAHPPLVQIVFIEVLLQHSNSLLKLTCSLVHTTACRHRGCSLFVSTIDTAPIVGTTTNSVSLSALSK